MRTDLGATVEPTRQSDARRFLSSGVQKADGPPRGGPSVNLRLSPGGGFRPLIPVARVLIIGAV